MAESPETTQTNEERAAEREKDFERDPDSPGLIQELASRIDGSFQLEMLISGTVLFLAFTLGGEIKSQLTNIRAAANSSMGMLLVVSLLLGNGLVFMLLGSLLVHLLLRSFWVGIVGIATVFPHGVRQDKIWGGPLTRAFTKRRTGNLEKQTESVDRACRLVFGLTFSFLATMGFGLVLVGVIIAITFLLRASGLLPMEPVWIFFWVFTLLYAPYLLVLLVDYLQGRAGVDEKTRGYTVFARIALAYLELMHVLTLQKVLRPVLTTISSNIPKGHYAIVMVSYIVLLYIGMFQPLVVANFRPIRTDVSLRTTQQAHHYLNLRISDDRTVLPLIDRDVYSLSDGYVRLFLPYRGRFQDSLSAWYPALPPIEATGLSLGGPDTDSTAVLPNLIALASCYSLTLDGAPLQLPYRLYSHPVLKADGLLAYIPLNDLKPGEHTLVAAERAGSQAARYHIPFYVHP